MSPEQHLTRFPRARSSTPEVARLLAADFTTGKLFWRERTPDMFHANHQKRACAIWNTRFAGKEAFTAVDGKGYRMGGIFGGKYSAHRVLWFLAHDKWPADQIDHINGDRSDNRLENLRAVTNAENSKNMRMRRTNKSGIMGVSWNKKDKKWRAGIRVNGRVKYLGQFDDIMDAAAARKCGEIEHGYHENHGRVT